MMDYLDLYAGAGGWDVAAHTLGMDGLGIELDPPACATRRAAGLRTVRGDVRVYRPQGFPATGLIASPPCQTFSKAGSGKGRLALEDVLALVQVVDVMGATELGHIGGRLGDERTGLVVFPLWYALHGDYRWLAWEQVPSVLPVWEACAGRLRERGWHVWTGTLNAEQYGVPQTRTRAFLIANRDHPVGPPVPTHSRFHTRTPDRLDPGVEPWVSMAEALGWGQGDPVGIAEREAMVVPEWSTHTPMVQTVAPFPRVPEGTLLCPTNLRPHAALRRLDQPAPTMAFGHERPRWITPEELAAYRARVAAEVAPRVNNQSGTDFDLAWPADRPAPTLAAGRDLVGMPGANANRFNGRTKSRNDGVFLAVGEAAALQTFPRGFPFRGPRTKHFQQIGNAIPALLAEAVLRAATNPTTKETQV